MTVKQIEIRIIDERIHTWGIPKHMTHMSAGVDLFACVDHSIIVEPQEKAILISSGIAIQIADEHIAALILPRSGMGHKGLILGNAVGLIDADYSNTLMISAWNRNKVGSEGIVIEPGDRIAQLVFVPIIRANFDVVDKFSTITNRSGGFGSTGIKAQ